jgi:hypothetical protein
MYSHPERAKMPIERKLTLRDAVRHDIRTRYMSVRAEEHYVDWIRAFGLLSGMATSGQDGCRRRQCKVARRRSARTFTIATCDSIYVRSGSRTAVPGQNRTFNLSRTVCLQRVESRCWGWRGRGDAARGTARGDTDDRLISAHSMQPTPALLG